MLKGVQVSSSGVNGVWGCHDLLTRHQRLPRLEKHVSGSKIELMDEQIRLLERFSPEFRERHRDQAYHCTAIPSTFWPAKAFPSRSRKSRTPS